MKLIGFRHKGLSLLHERDDGARLDRRMVEKLRRQLTFLGDMGKADELRRLQFWKCHRLSDGRWSLHVTANWRLTFVIEDGTREISAIDLEDYH